MAILDLISRVHVASLVCACLYVCVCVCVYVYIYNIHTYIYRIFVGTRRNCHEMKLYIGTDQHVGIIILLISARFPSRRDSSVGIVTSYGLYGLGFESRQGQEIFKDGPDRPPIQWVPGFRPRGGGRSVKLTNHSI
jgi:hypothetical protein